MICCCLSSGWSVLVYDIQGGETTYEVFIEFSEAGFAMVIDDQDTLNHGGEMTMACA